LNWEKLGKGLLYALLVVVLIVIVGAGLLATACGTDCFS
jgi:hypothetical protein